MKNNKIVLINPPSSFLIDEKVFPSLGLLSIATEMKKKGMDVKVFDFNGEPDYELEMESISGDFDIFGFTSTTPQFPQTYKLLQILKRNNRKAVSILGGPHASGISAMREREIKDINISPLEEFDFIVGGEGEGIDEKILKSKTKWVKTDVIKNLDDISIPDRDFLDIKSYNYELNGKPTTTLMTQRGCPFQCIFCCGREIDMYRITRMHSPDRVLEEMDYLNNKFGFSSFMWFDDEININSKRLIELSRKLQKRQYQHRGLVRSDLLIKHPETLEAIADAGFIDLAIGIESGSNRILKIINKKTTYDINMKACQMIKGEGIKFKANIVVGHPTETYQDIMLSKKWMKEAKPDSCDITILTPYPGSKVYDNAKPSDKFEGYEWEYNGIYFKKIDYSKEQSFYKGKPGEYTCNIRTDELTSNDLIKIRDEMEKELKL